MTPPADQDPAPGDSTSSVPGYQPTERLDLAHLSRAVSDESPTAGAEAAHAPLEQVTGAIPRPPVPSTAPVPAQAPVPALATIDGGDNADRRLGPPILAAPPVPPRPPEPATTTALPTTSTPPEPPESSEPSASTEPIERETTEILRRLPRPVHLTPSPERQVIVIDLPVYRLRRPGDLVAGVLATIAIVFVLLLAVFAHATTEGVTQDVSNALPDALSAVLGAFLGSLEGIVTLLLPLVIGLAALFGRRARQLFEAIAAAAAATGVAIGANWLLFEFGSDALVYGLRSGQTAFAPIIAGLAAYLTVMGTSERRRLVTWTWNLLWLTLVLQVLRSGMTLPAGLTSVLIGRAIGLYMRYVTGVLGERAYGERLVIALRRCGVDPERILRIVDGRPVEDVEPEIIVTAAPIGYVNEDPTQGLENGAAEASAATSETTEPGEPAGASDDEAAGPVPRTRTRDLLAHTWDISTEIPPIRETIPVDPTLMRDNREPREKQRTPVRTATAVVGEEEGENRIYTVRDVNGTVWDVGVLDGDRQVVGTLAATWNTLRLRGPSHRTTVSLRAAVDRAALMAYAVEAAGVSTPRLRGLALEDDSAVLVSEHVPGTQTLADVQTRRLTDDVLDSMWRELRTAHAAGIAHRSLDDHAVLLDGQGNVLLTGWSQGEISSPQLSRRLDLVALLALIALRVGPERAMASAVRNLTSEDLQSIAPIFQVVVLPERTRPDARKNKKVLKEVQNVLLGILPSGAEVEPVQMRRFSARTIITVSIAVVASWVVLTSINLTDMLSAVGAANPYWMAAAFVLGLTTYVGAAMALVAFAPTKLNLWRTTLVQVAASIVGLVAPAGVGPAALNLRYLQKNKLDTPMSVATVALVQVSQFLTTVLLLLGLALVTGSSGALDGLPSGAVLAAIAGIVVVVATALFVPPIRRWALSKIMPTLRQIWPRIVWVVGQPGRLVAAIAGNVIMTVGYVTAFGFTLLAFGQNLPVTALSIVYLAGNTAGSLVPTPGGIGAVELALTSGLTAAGINAAIAASIAVVFRLLTFWVRVPVGWVALQWLQKRNHI